MFSCPLASAALADTLVLTVQTRSFGSLWWCLSVPCFGLGIILELHSRCVELSFPVGIRTPSLSEVLSSPLREGWSSLETSITLKAHLPTYNDSLFYCPRTAHSTAFPSFLLSSFPSLRHCYFLRNVNLFCPKERVMVRTIQTGYLKKFLLTVLFSGSCRLACCRK